MNDTGPDRALTPGDRAGALVLLAVVTVVAVAAIVLTRDFPPNTLPTDVGPARFPVLHAVVLIVLCAICAVETVRAPHAAALPPPPGARIRVALAVAAVAVAIAAMPHLGFPVTAALFLYAVIWLMGRRQILGNAVYAVAASAAIWLLFSWGLNVPLPVLELGAG
ncbi:tripartite tricarboxylate transporter TctB family protein [Mangrovicoccus algicola]|uniref:Tripartite tricarboxylate transporter TctB family protein n=1 Tax=Mangrovicoccus algicola TaxID=2771008 RepID=A0A8J6YYY1_9RHOB|nr:tripartite tricarboxylate transporter TctB family protein [Mangrovicoccus algicola]MBE3640165.1 tripartite tricarboxylate transporter TctB family protein [Mangrovicoccus algicola]